MELTDDQVRRVEKRLGSLVSDSPRFSIVISLAVMGMIVAGFAISEGLMNGAQGLGLSYNVSMAIRIIGTPLLLIGVWFALFPRIIRPRIRRAMRECGLNICIRCGYELEGLSPDTVCPECGKAEQPPPGVAEG
jgi:hypothetical protein